MACNCNKKSRAGRASMFSNTPKKVRPPQKTVASEYLKKAKEKK